MKKLIMVLTVVLCLLTSTVVASAATDPNVVLVNPASSSTIYSNTLLISVKITQPKTIQVTVYEEKQMVNGTLSAVNVNTLTASNGAVSSTSLHPTLITTEKHTSTNNLSFYTKQVNGLKPGLYRIEVKAMDPSGKETGVSNNRVVIKEKAEEETKVFESTQSGTMQFLQSLLKSIFGE